MAHISSMRFKSGKCKSQYSTYKLAEFLVTVFMWLMHDRKVALSFWNKSSPPGNMTCVKGCKWSATMAAYITAIKTDSNFVSSHCKFEQTTQHCGDHFILSAGCLLDDILFRTI